MGKTATPLIEVCITNCVNSISHSKYQPIARMLKKKNRTVAPPTEQCLSKLDRHQFMSGCS